MAKKNKGRQKIEMVKMKNESNLQVTFSKRRAGLFKKASELCTLCGAEIAIIVFSPGRKVFSFGHPSVESVIDRFLNNNRQFPQQQHNMQHNEVHRNSVVENLNMHLTEVLSHLESEKKKTEEQKKLRETTKDLGHWWENPVEELTMNQLRGFGGRLEIMKKEISHLASKLFQPGVPNFYAPNFFNAPNFFVGSSSNAVPNFFVGSSSNAVPNFFAGSSSNGGVGIDDGSHINPDLDPFSQRRLMDISAFNFNQNPIQPNPALPFGYNTQDGNVNEGFGPENNMTYRPDLEYNPHQNYRPEYNQNQNQTLKTEDISEYEYQHGYPPHSGPGPSGY